MLGHKTPIDTNMCSESVVISVCKKPDMCLLVHTTYGSLY